MFELSQLKIAALVAAFAVTSGCASFSCGVPGGSTCKSVSDVYDAREANQLKHQRNNLKDNEAGLVIINEPATSSIQSPILEDDQHSGQHLKSRQRLKEEAILSSINESLTTNSFLVKNIEPSTPILSRPDVLRVYVARHQADDDFHDEQFIYLRLDSGKWLLTDN